MRRALFLFIIGCSHETTPPVPPPPPPLQHTCATASAKLTDVIVVKIHASAEDAKRFAAAAEKACTDDRWPAIALECVDNAPDHDAMRKCGHDHLSRTQMESFERAVKAIHHEDGGSLAVTSIEPDKGDAAGGTYVRIGGSNFIADGARNARVYFGQRQGTVVRFASDSELIVEAPGGTPDDQVDVRVVFEPGGELKIPKGFTFVAKP